MIWSILLVKKSDNGWFINYIENKLRTQIQKLKLRKEIEIVIFKPNSKFSGDYVNVIDEYIDISDNYISTIYNKLKTTNKDCVGLKGLSFIDKTPYISNNTKIDEQLYLPITKLNTIKKELIFKLGSMLLYINSKSLSNIVDTIEETSDVTFFKKDISNEPISIIITAYQSQDYIEECLDSVENQTYFSNNNNFNVLVGVDGCQDTLDKLDSIKHKYRNLSIYMMSKNKGTYITTNTLIDLVKTENVIRFDSDDIMTPNLVKEVLDNKKDNDIIMFGSVQMRDGVIDYTNFLMAEGIIYFKKSVMDNVIGGYQPWICAADTELIKRVVNKVKIYQLKKSLFYRRLHSNSLTHSPKTGYFTEIRKGYKSQIKSVYKDNEVKIERVVNKFKEIENQNIQIIRKNKKLKKNVKKKCVFNQFFGLGDILFIEPIMRQYFQNGYEIILPVLNKFLELKYYFPYINFVDKDLYNINYEEQNVIDDEEKMILPMRWSREFFNSSINYTMRNKYRMVNMELDEWRNLTWLRHREKEENLKKILGIKIGDKFNLINQNFHTFNNLSKNIDVKNGLRNIKMDFIDGYTLLDWASVIELATTIHTVDTSILFMIEILNCTTDLNLYSRYGNLLDYKKVEYLFNKKYIKNI